MTVPKRLQKSKLKKDKYTAQILHLKYAPHVIKNILKKINYGEEEIKKIIEIVQAHKFQNPRERNKKLLIDADCLADAFREQFDSDVKSYDTTPLDMYKIRKTNKFYTKTAREIFDQEMKKRKQEFS